MSDFADSEYASLDLGDERRNRRLRQILSSFLQSPKRSIQAACNGWAESIAAYRLFNSKAATLDAILAPHREATKIRVREHRSVALIQDTTTLDFSRKTQLEGTGPLGPKSKTKRGLFLHSQFAVTEDRVPLGVYHTHLYAREKLPPGKKRVNNHSLPIEKKESNRWLIGYRQACELATAVGDGTEVFSISDREGDIYEIYEYRELLLQNKEKPDEVPAHWIVRASKDRVLMEPKKGGETKWVEHSETLFEQSGAGALLGTIEFSVTETVQAKHITKTRKTTRHHRSKREVKQEVRVMKVTPRVPRRPGGKKLAPVSYWVIDAREIDPPEGEEAIHWVLLTSFSVKDFAAAQRILRLYVARWDIEILHRILKTGCRVEELQLKTQEALRPCLGLYLIVAWRILYLTRLGRECPDLPCSVVFEDAEWKAVVTIVVKRKMKGWKELTDDEPTLSVMLALVSAFGGHLGRSGDGPPGPQSMWQGLTRVRDFALAWEVFTDH